MNRHFSVIILLFLTGLLLGIHTAFAQDGTIEITGIVENVGDGTIVVNGLPVDLSSVDPAVTAQLTANAEIRIVGSLQNGVVVAVTIEIIRLPEPTPIDGVLLNGFVVSYRGRVYDPAANQTTFTYSVNGTNTPPDLSHFDVGIPLCSPTLITTGYTPADAVSFGTDPTTGVNGIKWDSPLSASATRTYSVSFQGNIPEGSVTVAVKGGDGFQAGTLPGPGCPNASVDIEKFVSGDGGVTWQDADDEPGLEVNVDTPVSFRFVVTNTGQSALNNLVLTDNTYDLSTRSVPANLPPQAFFECTAGPFPAQPGQHTNLATVVAVAMQSDGGFEVRDTDPANYFAGDRPSINIQKFITVEGSSSDDDDDGGSELRVEPGSNVTFRFVVTNDGNVPVTDITLNDSAFELTSCVIPTVLDPGASFECVVGPLRAEDDEHTNTVTVTAHYNEFTVIDSDTASYSIDTPDDDDDDTGELPVTIVIEGPVQQINVNIITIYDIDIEINVDDPILTVIQLGDEIRVEGDMVDNGTTIIIVAINIVIIDVDIVISDDGGVVWRDSGDDCGNPPPPWAPAHGWRRRCEGGGGSNTVIIIDDDDDDRGRGKQKKDKDDDD